MSWKGHVLSVGVVFSLGFLFGTVVKHVRTELSEESPEEPCKDIYYDGDWHNTITCPHKDHKLDWDGRSKMVFCRCE